MANKIYEQFVPPVTVKRRLTKDQKQSKTKEKPYQKKKKHPTKPNGKPTNQQAPGTQFKRLAYQGLNAQDL